MLGGTVRWIMSIIDLINWFVKPRLQIKPAQPPAPNWGLYVETERQKNPRWYADTQLKQLQKNPRYKSSNGF